MSSPVDAAVNPLDPSQRYVLWGNGRIDGVNVPPITDNPQWYDRPDQPVARALHIVNWTTGAGYVLDKQGGFHRINGAPQIGEAGEGDAATHEVVVGVIYAPFGAREWYVDWSWDPFHPGAGVVLDGFGKLWPFGGAPTPTRSGNRWGAVHVARKIEVDWGNLRAYTLDYSGGIHPDYNAGPVKPFDDLVRTFNGPRLPGDAPYWLKADVARDFTVTDWNPAAPKGYTLDFHGAVHEWGGAQSAAGFPYRKGGDHARLLTVLNATNPARFWEVWAYGQEFEWTASTPPTVTAGGFTPFSPATSVTNTTRPPLAWAYSDAQNDAQAAWEIAVFTSDFVAANNMSDPSVHKAAAVLYETGIDSSLRAYTPNVDFPNGAYRMYVRVKDTADQWSAWANRAWTQAVPIPVTPTDLTAEADHAELTISLRVNATTGGSADSIRFESSDDGGLTWQGVRGAESLPIAAVVTATDYDAPLNLPRLYRAFSFNDNPRVRSASSNTVAALIPVTSFAITSAEYPDLGGRFLVQDPISWSNPTTTGVFEGIGAKYPTVVSDGVPKARRFTIRVVSIHENTWRRLSALVHSDSTLVFRDPLGDVIYCRIVGDITTSKPKGSSAEYQHNIEIPVVEIAPPIGAV